VKLRITQLQVELKAWPELGKDDIGTYFMKLVFRVDPKFIIFFFAVQKRANKLKANFE
jgi:hypothetical protein